MEARVMRLKAIPEKVLELDFHQSLDYRKVELAVERLSAEELRPMLLAATRSTMIQQNIVRFLMVNQ
jgi:hypothetical protein